jgi:hypothetical protein
VRYVDHEVAAARAMCAERCAELRLMLAQTRPAPRGAGEPDDGVAALRAWVTRPSPRMLDTADLLTEDRLDDFDFSNDAHGTPAAQPQVAQSVARWLAEGSGLGLSLAPAR